MPKIFKFLSFYIISAIILEDVHINLVPYKQIQKSETEIILVGCA